ncbi:MAG: pentapeptide repeat-containing protein [Cyclobacteriaceae bacterium]
MTEGYFDEEHFKSQDFSTNPLVKGEYEGCVFLGCKFTRGNLTDVNFIDCEFVDCDLSNVKLSNTAFKNVSFKSCKMLGLHFEDCNKFLLEMRFENCTLDLSSFYQLSLKSTVFKNCSLQEVDFTESDFSRGQLINCDLASAVFDRTNLQSADLSSATNFNIDPENNNIKKAKFALGELQGLLNKYDILVK